MSRNFTTMTKETRRFSFRSVRSYGIVFSNNGKIHVIPYEKDRKIYDETRGSTKNISLVPD